MSPSIQSVEELEDLLSTPTDGVIETMARHDGDILVLGAAGKMGPSLARMAKRASDAAGVKRRIIAVSRFSTKDSQAEFQVHGIETIRCDLLQPDQLAALPDAPLIIYMAGMKFGSTGNESLTWAMNSYLPGMVCQRFPKSRIVAFSTGNVYHLTPVTLGGSVETDPTAPVGEYAQSCLGRERIFEHFSRTLDIPVSIIRLTYAIDMRYGVLLDMAQRVHGGLPVNLAMGNVNVIWQADANAMSLQSLDLADTPPFILNVAGAETLSVRRVSEQYGALLGKSPVFEGAEAQEALLVSGQLSHRLFGYPRIGAQQLLHWTADWVERGGSTLNKPTHFETRDGKF